MAGLFDTLTLGSLLLKNRIVMAPLTRCRAGEERLPNTLMKEYYRQRAGAGLIITEGAQISLQAIGYPNTPGIHSESQIKGWKAITDEVHNSGGLIFLQLWHTGRISHPDFLPSGMHPLAPSAIAAEGKVRVAGQRFEFPIPRELSTAEVEETIQDYIAAGLNAQKAGFDGVELHAANGYLPEQFLNDSTNHRSDRFGGRPTDRHTFIMEIMEGLVKVWGANRVGIRLSPSAVRFGTLDSDPVCTYSGLAEKLNDLPLAYLHLVEPMTELPELYLSRVLPHFRELYNGRIITAAGYTPESAARVLKDGLAEMVAFGRLFIANPDLPERIRSGAELNEADQKTFYQGGAKGYTDYPSLTEMT